MKTSGTESRRTKDLLYEQVARIGKAAASPKRLELIELLCQGEKSVETLAREASIGMKLASAHLRAGVLPGRTALLRWRVHRREHPLRRHLRQHLSG